MLVQLEWGVVLDFVEPSNEFAFVQTSEGCFLFRCWTTLRVSGEKLAFRSLFLD